MSTNDSFRRHLTRPFRRVWSFFAGLPSFLREMRGFPRRARYTWVTRGARALLSDIISELSTRLRRGSLAPQAPPAALVAPAVEENPRRPIHLPQAPQPRASIVIPAHDGFAYTHACLGSILEHRGDVPFEVIVVDDASSDETRELEGLISGLTVVRNDTNLGFVEACNRGAAAARGEFVVFLNNDTFVTPGWLPRLLEPFEEPDVGLVVPKLLYPDGRLQEAGGIVFSDGSGWNYGRGDDPTNPNYEFRRDVHYGSGACLAVPRDLFEELGGFDTRFAPMYYEDVDLAFAARSANRRVVYQPACQIFHAEGGTAGTDTASGAKRYQVVNQQKFVAKWREVLAEHPPPGSNPDAVRSWPGGPQVLVIDSYTPRPDRDAGSVRMLNVFRILRRLGCHVAFLPENRALDGHYTRNLQAAGVEALYHPFLPTLEDHLKRAGARYDVVIVSRAHVAEPLLAAVRRHCPRARVVFDTVDLHFLREERRAELMGDPEAGRAARLKAQELSMARGCDLTLVVSTVERDVLAREAPDVAVEVLSLIQSVEPTREPFAEREGILFIANFTHPPNCDALEHYLREVHPAVQERLPGVPFTVIGAGVPRRLHHAGEGVRFAGRVPDIRPEFASARLSVAPLRYGAGIKGKISTSLAFRVPVVTTTIGAEGMNLEHGEHLLIADDPVGFADAVAALHSDEALWTRLAENGLRSVASQFSFEAAERTLARILELPRAEP